MAINGFGARSAKIVSYTRYRNRLIEVLEIDHMRKKIFLAMVDNKHLLDFFDNSKTDTMRMAKEYVDSVINDSRTLDA